MEFRRPSLQVVELVSDLHHEVHDVARRQCEADPRELHVLELQDRRDLLHSRDDLDDAREARDLPDAHPFCASW